ncbi:hypothetical protein FALBO_4839 [Fusarium albosuccineum]|uniref:Uncharacterized protein n=1 Tax=Fusarium albosuccineum TaxID=1237068 RepID=A0A8H4PKL9_9HYPO|nr:hypothetical protein FALBO_4839 [Fusarium albosuccineum]
MASMHRSLSALRRLPATTSVLNARNRFVPQSPIDSHYGPKTIFRMSSGNAQSSTKTYKTQASSDPKHDYKTTKPTSDLSEGASASLKATRGKQDATSFQNQNLTTKEKKVNGQNAQQPDSREGSAGDSSAFEKTGEVPRPWSK